MQHGARLDYTTELLQFIARETLNAEIVLVYSLSVRAESGSPDTTYVL